MYTLMICWADACERDSQAQQHHYSAEEDHDDQRCGRAPGMLTWIQGRNADMDTRQMGWQHAEANVYAYLYKPDAMHKIKSQFSTRR